jgi:hypothetical protein
MRTPHTKTNSGFCGAFADSGFIERDITAGRFLITSPWGYDSDTARKSSISALEQPVLALAGGWQSPQHQKVGLVVFASIGCEQTIRLSLSPPP